MSRMADRCRKHRKERLAARQEWLRPNLAAIAKSKAEKRKIPSTVCVQVKGMTTAGREEFVEVCFPDGRTMRYYLATYDIKPHGKTRKALLHRLYDAGKRAAGNGVYKKQRISWPEYKMLKGLPWGEKVSKKKRKRSRANERRKAAGTKDKPPRTPATRKAPRLPVPETPVFRTYAEYMQSRLWARKRREAIRVAGRCCQRCSTTDGPFDVHHLKYPEKYGEELPEDLQVLCLKCHVDVHEGPQREKVLKRLVAS